MSVTGVRKWEVKWDEQKWFRGDKVVSFLTYTQDFYLLSYLNNHSKNPITGYCAKEKNIWIWGSQMVDFLCHVFKNNPQIKTSSNYYVLSGREIILNLKEMVLGVI